MAGKLDKISDDKLRSRLDEVRGLMRANKPTDAVRTCVDVFLEMLRDHPKLLQAKTFIPVAGRRIPSVLRWPALGANLEPASLQSGEPKIVFIRDHFALSEAITYYEFTLDTALEQSL